MKVKILRQTHPGAEPYWEEFIYDGPAESSIASVIDEINFRDDIVTADGKKTTRIGWECACLQGMCGACAMVINGVPALACETFVKDLKGDVITIRPLTKFPVIHDLLTDRSSIQENLKKTNIYIEKYDPDLAEDHEHQYLAAKCLKCGLCLEVCPNYTTGKTFFGAEFANDCYLVSVRNKGKEAQILKEYRDHFGNACSKSLSCMDVCPMNIPTLASIGKLYKKKFK
ncbi:MAG: succinate dehydrogenase [Clostridiales bacterium]|nr:succinate dehydrogenase [Clostridiales bacterium]